MVYRSEKIWLSSPWRFWTRNREIGAMDHQYERYKRHSIVPENYVTDNSVIQGLNRMLYERVPILLLLRI